jgi:lantibiotic leader peptide-processing serine protease
MQLENTNLSTMPRALAEAALEQNPDNPMILRDCKGATCGYYQYLQGTSMASPHATGVAALIVGTHGRKDPRHGGLTMSPGAVERVMTRTPGRRRARSRPSPPTPTAPPT